jgi:hypothetical protein
MDVPNKFLVERDGDQVVIRNLPLQAARHGRHPLCTAPPMLDGGCPPRCFTHGHAGAAAQATPGMPLWPQVGPLSHDEALTLAAWLVAVIGQRERFNDLIDQIAPPPASSM